MEQEVHFIQGFRRRLQFGGNDQTSPIIGRGITESAIQAAVDRCIPVNGAQLQRDGINWQGVGPLQVAKTVSEAADPIVGIMGEDPGRDGNRLAGEIDKYISFLLTSHG